MKPNEIKQAMKKWEVKRTQTILKKLKQENILITLENIPKIIHKTSFAVRSKEHLNECKPCYNSGNPCHEMKNLNCFLCNCPQYDSDYISKENNRYVMGKCKISSKFGEYTNGEVGIWDCKDCKAYHHPKAVEVYIRNNLKLLKTLQDSL